MYLVLIPTRKVILSGFCRKFPINRNITKISLDPEFLHVIQQINIILTIEENLNQDNKVKMVLWFVKTRVCQQRHSSNEVFWSQKAQQITETSEVSPILHKI